MITSDDVFAKYKEYDDFVKENSIVGRCMHLLYKENHVFDEEKSVKWNREEVKRRNDEKRERGQKYFSKRAEMYNAFVDIVHQYIENELHLPRSKAEDLWSLCREHYENEPMCLEFLDSLINVLT